MLLRFSVFSVVSGIFLQLAGCSGTDSNAIPEIETSHKAQSITVGLVGHWKFDDGLGTMPRDATAYGHHGLIEGGGIYSWTTGKVAGGLQLGGGRHVRVEPTDTLNAIRTELTIASWIYRTTAPSPADEYIVYRRNTTLGSVMHLLQGPSGHVCLGIASSQICTAPVSFGTWHHFAGTWDGLTARVYVDGVQAASGPLVATLSFDSAFSLHVGSNQGGSLPWNGRLDETRLYARALEPNEITELYQNTPSEPYPSGQALLVVGDVQLTTSDLALHTRLTSLGFQVVVVDDAASTTADSEGKTLIVISESSASSVIGERFLNVAVPVLSLEPALFDDFRMAPTLTAWDAEIGDDEQQSSLVFSGTHPLTAGLTGTVLVASPAAKAVWARPTAPSLIKAATVVGDITKAAIFGYEMGSTGQSSFVFPHRRVGFFAGALTPAVMSTNGWLAFDAAVRWSVQPQAVFVVATGCIEFGGCVAEGPYRKRGLQRPSRPWSVHHRPRRKWGGIDRGFRERFVG